MSRPDDLHHDYADQNVWLQSLLGIVSWTEGLAPSLRRPGGRHGSTRSEIDPFVAALLGVLSLRAEIDAAARESTRRPARAEPVIPDRDRHRSRRVPGTPRGLMR